MNNKLLLQSIALDLKRVSLGYQKNSVKMADRFSQEVLKRKNQIDLSNLNPHIKKLLEDVVRVLQKKNVKRMAEDTLMYSTLFLNFAERL